MIKGNKMTPEEIIKKHISKVKGIRLPFIDIIAKKILNDFKDNGYIITDEYAFNQLMKKEK